MNKRARKFLFGAIVLACIVACFRGSAVFAEGAMVMMAAKIEPSITVSLVDTVSLKIVPSDTGRFGSERQTITVYTNSPAGYTVAMTPTSTDLTLSGGSATIPTLGSGTFTTSNFTVNRWGISVDSAAYRAVSSSTEFLRNQNSPTGAQADVITIDYGAKLDLDTESGEYSTTIDFAVVAKIAPKTIQDIIYMQDFATLTSDELSSVMRSMAVGDQYRLVDNRDNLMYFVAKQADGNIWMTQNLDLCIGCSGVATLTSENTDLNSADLSIYEDGYSTSGDVITWTPASTAITSSQSVSSQSVSPGFDVTTGKNVPYSAEGGSIYMRPLMPSSTSTDVGSPSLAACESIDYTEALCWHYHVGNYYNWTAAVASNNSSGMRETQARNSICPAGWGLPVGRESTTYEFGQLYFDSGIISSQGSGELSYVEGGFFIVRGDPLFFVRSGFVNGTVVSAIASNGYYWSKSNDTRSTGVAFGTRFNNGSIRVYEGVNRAYGYSVRCLVRPTR